VELVAVTGATGFVGAHVARGLRDAGVPVRAVVRPATRKGHRLADLRRWGCEVVEADVGDLAALERALAGCRAVVHLVAIIRERVGATFDLINRRGVREVAAAARAAGVGRIVHLSALGAGPQAPRYLQSKWAGEEELRRSGVPWVIFRPSFILGPGGGAARQFAAVVRLGPWYPLWLVGVPWRPLAALATLTPVVPVLGSGRYRSMPVDVRDVVELVRRALDLPDAIGQTYDVVGPDVLTYDALLDEVMAVLGVRRWKVHIPLGAARALVREMARLPSPPITPDEFEALILDNVGDPGPVQRVFGLTPRPCRDAIRFALATDAGGLPGGPS
jgi:uncharacterized protein YbjT (DUF2867 family)